jgi:hypothetical protein
MSQIGAIAVPPISRSKIRSIAHALRSHLQWEEPSFPIVEVMEHILPDLLSGYELQICDADELGVNHGLTSPDENIVRIREDVYNRACEGAGRDRMTMAHELGHLILHRDIGMARLPPDSVIPVYMDSEWQANCFGGELLICATHIHICGDVTEIANCFGVSTQAASTQWDQYKREAII